MRAGVNFGQEREVISSLGNILNELIFFSRAWLRRQKL